MVRDSAEPVIGPRFARTRWRFLTMRNKLLIPRRRASVVSRDEAAFSFF